jgi:hypothetical protein
MELMPEELLLAAMVRLAIRDATQCKNKRLQADALRWLWWVTPGIAERAFVDSTDAPPISLSIK